ncbi:MAG TPA: hypothetical protein VHX11_12105 [Acidobacteriaceae bacterium]|jgi:hypothetical protein|nr:hypothetical protein [Acidobacteriaceae bacterium]
MRRLFYLGLFALLPLSGFAQTKFDVATIRPPTERVEFERDGLGLQIASRTAAFDVLVVDHVEEPTAN